MRNSACLGNWAEAMNEQSWMSAVGKFLLLQIEKYGLVRKLF